ncbi:hypothetical protein [Mycobacterium sp.]|uniref:hypothetical protein n=1 Tax=Mycobacterium sp. TaxID=1785 RepID=UPI002B891838|nr:hypothetical protein [Mycobacterium sp.]HTQ17484.1 hypothetical protein [Mycobacterium sp.]
MPEPFIGSEALVAVDVTKTQLATRYRRLFPNVYLERNTLVNNEFRARAGWLWSGRRGVVAGFSAAALHGSKWVDDAHAVELVHDNRRPPPGIKTHADRVSQDEIALIDGLPVTTPSRTALDLGCWYPLDESVAAIDALLAATDLKVSEGELLAERYPGRRGIRRAREALVLADGGAQSPKETWLRLLLIRAGFPRPQTQIPVSDEFGEVFAYLDMGWEDLKIAAEYDGEQHRTNTRRYRWDVRRQEKVERQGWIDIRVVAGDQEPGIIRRVAAAWARRA